MNRSSKWPFDLDKLIFTHVVIIGLPTILYYCFREGGWSLLGLHIVIATLYLFSSLMIIFETTNAMFRRFAGADEYCKGRLDRFFQSLKIAFGIQGSKHPQLRQSLPRCSFIVAAYLPNEQDIICETLEHILLNVQRPEAGLEVVLAYNTPVDLPVEDDLRRLAKLYPALCLLRVEGSKSKAENLNAALNIVTGEITCILDADHHPAPDCFIRAWRWLERHYDVVQGRNVIRNHNHNLLAQVIAIEFETIYGVSHAAKSFLADTTIFGGSNGYWRTSVLKKIRFNPLMLTEDIDASIRTLLSGYHIIHDRSIITTELAPADFTSFWSQRRRWAQGWLEVSLKYQRRIWKSTKFNRWQKIYWTYLLYYREVYPLLALQIFPILFSLLLHQGSIPLTDNPYLWSSTVITLLSGVHQVLAVVKIAALKYPVAYFINYAWLTFFYTTLKNMISIVAIYNHLHGHDDWVVTPRDRKKVLDSQTASSQKAALLASSSLSSNR
jgi:cellulose synthase/poly-beta-1,6-N-acetylglucosamine synthase-like glycosyltransferase